MKKLSVLLIVWVMLSTQVLAKSAELVMVEEIGCYWCERWRDEIAPIYPKTAEGKYAPVRRVDIGGPFPAEFTFDGAFRYTPTFVLMKDGVELDRLEGYPGEDFFWGLLERMLKENTDYSGGAS